MFFHCPTDVLKASTAMESVFHWVTAVHVLSFLQMLHLITGQFKIIPPQNPVIAIIGEAVVLPCQLTGQNNPETIAVQWILSRHSEKIDVSTYDGVTKEERENERYQGRTQFFHTEFQAGNMSLNLKNVIVSDKGKYTCSVSLGSWYDEVVVELDVTARGGESSIFLEDYADQAIGLTCRSEGWFPEPQVLWLDSKGQKRTEKPTTSNTKTPAGIYNIESAINIEPGSDNEVSCKIINNILNTVSESRVLISDVFFPTTSPWMAAFLIILFLSITLIAAVGYKLKNNNDTTSRSVNEKKKMEEEKEHLSSALETNKRTEKTVIQEIQETIDRLSKELEFRRAQSYAVPITLDPDCKHPELKLSEDQKRVWKDPSSPELDAASWALLVVGKEGFVAGRQYWEVEVGEKLDWELGVLSQMVRDRVKREKAETLPEEGYWSLKRSQGDFFSGIENAKIEKMDCRYKVIGVFLDREEKKISFYDAGMMFLITTIPADFTDKFLYYPFLSPRNNTGEQKALAVHPIRVPVPLKPLRKEK
ncbi:butyrophilin subfamily 3 member A2-like [Dermochelys coriacea]|uniref:butyrophilin subfamily 3 member A2-like n=1 Tax=Dermochelys coriacea TaxID=27794 RepID=UPI0018E850F7|nr:butyrophilin subfamily 3 member A2-like [Dermochelys coriacea]XP_043357303.1 butyrophilin subfamily 3 member A2-like [Dermochelys coriacea]